MRGDMGLTVVENVIVRGDIEFQGEKVTIGSIDDLIDHLANVETRLSEAYDRISALETRTSALGL